MSRKLYSFRIFAFSIWDKGYSGGDRIFIELSRRLVKSGNSVDIYTWERGKEIITREQVQGAKLHIFHLQKWLAFGFAFQYAMRIVSATLFAFFAKEKDFPNDKRTIIYCASDFWMDSLPCYILKKRFTHITWIGTWYLSAPNPFVGFREQGKAAFPSLHASLYWIQQKCIYPLMSRNADIIFVTSIPDARKFGRHWAQKRYVVISGGVDVKLIKRLQKRYQGIEKKYDAIFMGRFHPQKGVLELLDIWEKVTEKRKDARLAIIGDGLLMGQVVKKIQKLHLEKNVSLEGYVLDGPKKYSLFSQSKIFVHPVIYDSGGMSAAEAMVWGLPAVSFDLEALKTYYPKGMVKVQIGNLDEFAHVINKLLTNNSFYERMSKEAKELIEHEWDWDKRFNNMLGVLHTYLIQ